MTGDGVLEYDFRSCTWIGKSEVCSTHGVLFWVEDTQIFPIDPEDPT
jgi:hypothetical protein